MNIRPVKHLMTLQPVVKLLSKLSRCKLKVFLNSEFDLAHSEEGKPVRVAKLNLFIAFLMH